MSADVLPWGETLADLAAAVLNDPNAPPVLALAAVRLRLLGDDRELRSLVDAAIELDREQP